MTDRLKGVIVTFDQGIRTDDAESIIGAIRHIVHVADVSPVVEDYQDHMAQVRVRSQLYNKLHMAINEAFK